ncbi:MAG: type 4a pilus biogenesis protein PilO [Moorellaceae bacterium]
MEGKKWRNLTPRERILLFLFLLAAALVFAHRVVLGRQLPYYLQVKTELGEESLALREAQKAAGELPLLKEELARAEAEMSEAKGRLGLTLKDKESFLIAAQPQEEGVKVLAFQPLETEKRGDFTVQPFQVSAVGTYPQIQNYIHHLEHLPAWTQIRELKLTARPGSKGEVEASLVLDYYDLGEGNSVTGQAVALLPGGRAEVFLPPVGEKPGGPDTNIPEGMSGGREPSTGSNPPATSGSTVPSGSQGTAEGEGWQDIGQSEGPEYAFPTRGYGRSRASAPWLEGIRVLRNVGPFYYPAGRKIAIGGRQFEHGIVVDLSRNRDRVEAVLDLQGGYLKLRGFIGVEDGTQNSTGGLILRLKGDEREIFTSPLLKPGGYPQYVEVNVTGVNRLIIQAEWQEAGPGDYDRLRAALADMFLSTT